MKEIIGYTLNKFDSGEIDREILVAQLQSGIVECHFSLSRYRLTLKTADFMDNLSVIAPDELMGGGQQQQPNLAQGFGGGPQGQNEIDPEFG